MPSKPIPGSTGDVLTCLPSPYLPHAPTGLLYLPRFLEITDALPHTPTGRVQKFALRERGVGPNTWDRVAAGFEVTR